MKSIFQFKKAESTEKTIVAHIIVENEIYSLVDVNGAPISEEFASSPFAPLLCKIAKDNGLKMCGIAHMDVDFAPVVNMIEETVEATITQIGMIADFVSETAQEIVDAQEDSQVRDDAAIDGIKANLAEAVAMLDQLSTTLKAQVKLVEQAEEKIVDVEWDVSTAEDWETQEEWESRLTLHLLEDAHTAIQKQGFEVEMKSSTWNQPYYKREDQPVDRLVVTYGKTEFVLIVDDLQNFTLCQMYDRVRKQRKRMNVGEDIVKLEHLVTWCENELEQALIEFDTMCEEQEQDQDQD